MRERSGTGARRNRCEGLSQKALETLHRAVKAESRHRIRAVMGCVLSDGFAKRLLRSRDVTKIICDLKCLANRIAKRPPGLRLASGSRRAHHGAGREKRAGFGPLIADKIDFGLAFPGLTGRDSIRSTHRAADNPDQRRQPVAMKRKPDRQLFEGQNNKRVTDQNGRPLAIGGVD